MPLSRGCPHPGIEPASPMFPALLADSLLLSHQGSSVAGTTALFNVLCCTIKNVFFCVSFYVLFI